MQLLPRHAAAEWPALQGWWGGPVPLPQERSLGARYGAGPTTGRQRMSYYLHLASAADLGINLQAAWL